MIKMLKEEILNNWEHDILNTRQIIPDLKGSKFPAWTVKYIDSYGVAIPYSGEEEINENFAEAKIQSGEIDNSNTGETEKVLLLTTNKTDNKISFSSLCESLIDPGEDGNSRIEIERSPITWWEKWKELLGNRDVDERVYDVLGELCGLLYAVNHDGDAAWNGPDGASYDIETPQRFIEIKSSTNRSKKEITISSQFQLFPPNKPLDLVFCVFEPVFASGISIDSILKEIDKSGYDVNDLNRKLETLGLETGMSARKKQFILHEMLLYKVDQSFPRITPESFTGGIVPEGITKITYTVDLSGLTPISLMQGDTNDI